MKRVNSPKVKLLYDIYHMQIMEGDLIRTIRENIDFIGHFLTGGNPGRHELDGTQEVNWHAVAKAIADTGYQGFVSHEFVPAETPPIQVVREPEPVFDNAVPGEYSFLESIELWPVRKRQPNALRVRTPAQ